MSGACASGGWRDESRTFFERCFTGTDLRAVPPTSYVVEVLAACPVPLDGASVLDVGCGGANNLRWLGERWALRRAVGIETSPPVAAALGAAFPQHAFVPADAVVLPFAADSFDLVILRSVLHWVDRGYLLHALGEAVRVCRRWLLVSDFAPAVPYSVAYRHDARRRTWKADPTPLLAATGLLEPLAVLRHHADDEWNAVATSLWRKSGVDEAYPLRDEDELRRPVASRDVAHATRVLAAVGEPEPLPGERPAVR